MSRRIISVVRSASYCQRLLSKSHPRPHSLPGFVTSSASARNNLHCSPVALGAQVRWHGDGPGPDAPTVNVTFVNPDDSQIEVSARVGETLLQTAHRTGVEMEGACEGVCACSTCHVTLEQDLYDRLLDGMDDGALSEDEEDMLDMAFGLTHTSRLGCQIEVGEDMEGSVFTLPKATRNFYVDGHKPTPH
ncbi:hypothetical protein ACHAWF_011736 [Thalassiosira exigua]